MSPKRTTPEHGLPLGRPDAGGLTCMDIIIPPEALNRTLRHPALRAHGPSRAVWQAVEGEIFSGRQRRLSRGDATLEITLLQGVLRGGPVERPIQRLAVTGEGAAMFGAEMAQTLPLLPAMRDLATEAAAMAGLAPARMPTLSGQTGTAGALAAAIREGLAALLTHGPNCRADAPPLGVHQSRVALRRMRSVLKLFRPAVASLLRPGEFAAFDGRLKALAAALGPARDWDVFLGGMAVRMQAALPGEKRLRPMLLAARKARLAGYRPLPALLSGPGFRATIWAGIAIAERLEAVEAQEDLMHFAAHVLGRRHRRLRRGGENIELLPAAELHALRLDAKRLRYATELLAPLWPGQAPRRYLRRLMKLQDALGLANDADVARGLVRGLGTSGWALGLAEGFALAGAAGSRDMALDAWADWQKSKRFWRDA